VIRACGATDVLPVDEPKSRAAMQDLYGWDHQLSSSEFEAFAERWRPFRTWAAVVVRALSGRLERP